jgi:hypothetical protein
MTAAVTKIISATAQDLVKRLEEMGIRLDGSEGSLTDLDAAIDLLWGEARPPEEYFDGMVWGYGCYVADVIQRHHPGKWEPSEEIGYDFVPANGTATGINPWHWVEWRFQLGDLLTPMYQSAMQPRPR